MSGDNRSFVSLPKNKQQAKLPMAYIQSLTKMKRGKEDFLMPSRTGLNWQYCDGILTF
jgi:hypothetical protein